MSTLHFDALEPLFYSPLLSFHLPDAEALNRRLLEEVGAIRASSPGQRRSNQNGWHSDDDFFDRSEPACNELKIHMLDAVRQATQRISPAFDFAAMDVQVQGWINVNGKGGYNSPHDHPNWTWSGCYYVRVPDGMTERSGCIEFVDHRTNVRVLGVEGAACFMSKYIARPRPGMLLLFPSWLWHWVYPNDDVVERVTIAFNARFVPAQRR